MTGGSSLETHVFVFGDLESSTRLWQRFPDAMKVAMERHDAILREAVERGGGQVVRLTGDGLLSIFPTATEALKACLAAQQRLHAEAWGETGPLRVRMGMHVGEAQPRAGDYYGPAVNRAARITAAAHGGQIVLSSLVAQLADGRLPDGAELHDLGEHRLKDLFQSEHLFQLVHPALPGDFPPLVTLSRRPNNLPTQTSVFLGREAQLSAIRPLLDAPDVRLLTLTGPGGIGKTRLALQAAADQIDRFDDGVYFVDLSPVHEPDAVFEAVVRALGLTGTSDERPVEIVRRQLQPRQLLLVLDNFEQVVEAAGGVADLLQHCPRLKALVTSREALRVRGEHLFPVPPLTLPNGSGAATAEAVSGYEAVRLFVERAREVVPDFALTDGNVAAVSEICARLDGLPLAIELAASRLRLFPPDELRDRLRTRLELLRGGPRDAPARQRTLRDTIAWSYELLDDAERAIFKLLAVFAPTRIEAVEDVAARLEALRDIDVVDRLTSLVDKSLLRCVDIAGRQRLSMLETIRDFATERLGEDSDLGSAASRAHSVHFSEFAQRRRARLLGRDRESTLDDLESELGNLTKAWRYWVDERDLEQLNRLLDGLWALYDARGWYHAAIELTNDLLELLSAIPATADRAREEITLRTSLARGLLATRGYTQEVEEMYNQALALAEQVGELPQQFPVLRGVASFYMFRGEFDKAAEIGQKLMQLAEQEHDVGLQVEGHLLTGTSVSLNGNIPASLEHLERAIALFDPQRGSSRFHFGPSPGVVSCTTSAFLLWLTGYPDRALERATRALDLARRMNHPYTQAYASFHVGFLHLWRREWSQVEERAHTVLEVAQDRNYPIWKALALILQGTAMAALGRPEVGLARMEEGVALYQGLKTPPIFWPLVLSVRAQGFALGSRPAEGLELIDQAIGVVGESYLLPEFALLKGELLLALNDSDGAATWFQRAFDVAGQQATRMSQLRAATRLARHRQAHGDDAEADAEAFDALREVYATFTEGFDTADLHEARAILGGVTPAV